MESSVDAGVNTGTVRAVLCGEEPSVAAAIADETTSLLRAPALISDTKLSSFSSSRAVLETAVFLGLRRRTAVIERQSFFNRWHLPMSASKSFRFHISVLRIYDADLSQGPPARRMKHLHLD